ncbi:MAG: alpha/beta hydrolase [Chloroflexota bacterium]
MLPAPPSRCAPAEARGRPALTRLLVGAGVAAAATASAAVGGAVVLTRAIVGPGRPAQYDDYVFTPFEAGIPYDRVAVPARDGTLLSGWWLPRAQSARAVICCSHYRGRKSDLLGIAGALWRSGCSVFLFDYRGHGEHVGTPVTLGYREVDDLLAAVDVVRALAPEAALGAVGYSMGAAVALMGAARQPAIQAVVADSGFARQEEAIRTGVREQLGLPIDPLLPLINLLVYRQLGYRFQDVEPLRTISALTGRPVLIIHGAADAVVDVSQAYRLYEAAGEPKDLWILPRVGHCGAYFADREAYCARVADFFTRALTSRPGSARPAVPAASRAHT